MLNIAICEDSPADVALLEGYISRHMGGAPFNLKTYSDGGWLLSDLPDNAFDIIFMDIMIKDLNGIDLAAQINRLQQNARIIYQSSNLEFFKSVYRTSHIYFLHKPFEYDDFAKAMEKAVKSLEKSYIVIKNSEKIRCDDIFYIELINHDTIFCLNSGAFVSERLKTKELLELLPQSFIRCHKGYIVNIDRISSYKAKKHFTVENGQVIPIGNKYAGEVNEKIIKYWGDSIIC